MKKNLYKFAGWGGALSAYVLLAVIACLVLFDWDAGQISNAVGELTSLAGLHQRPQPLLGKGHQEAGLSGILLPLAPREGHLPGFPAIWKAFSSVHSPSLARKNIDGFDGAQAVENVEAFFHDSVDELFLASPTRQVFRRGDTLLILRDQGNVLLVDCKEPRLPKISGTLPYQNIKQMEMREGVAYLLVGEPELQDSKMVIADLKDPYQPRELAQISLPENVRSFLLFDHRLVVHSSTGGPAADSFVYTYILGEESQLIPLGSSESPPFTGIFLKHKGYLFTGDSRTGLQIIDFSDPLHPVAAGFLDLTDHVKQITRYGDRLFIFGGQGNLWVVDVHDPVKPVLESVFERANHLAHFMEFDRYTYFFTPNGYLRVFAARPADVQLEAGAAVKGLTGELVASRAGAGFTLLGSYQGALPSAVTGVLNLPAGSTIVASAVWQGRLVVLDERGLLRFFRLVKDSPPEFQEQLQLTGAQRWLAAGNGRLYVGGESTVSIVASGDDGHFVVSGAFAAGAEESWQGVVVGETLCIAAGRAGLLSFSLQQPDLPVAGPPWRLPVQLRALADVKQLAVASGEHQLLVAAGGAGLLRGTIDADGQFQLQGALAFSEPVSALALIAGFCLVPTAADVHIIDVNATDSLQNVGKIALPNVTRLAVAAPDFWAGYVPGAGWSILPAPHRVSPSETEKLQASGGDAVSQDSLYRYRLNIFNDHDVINVPGVVHRSALSDKSRIARP